MSDHEQQQPEPGGVNLHAGKAIATAVVQIKRAATGKVDEYTLEFKPLPDEQQTEAKEA